MTDTLGNSSFTIIDYSDIHTSILRILFFDIIGFSGYAVLLYTYCMLWQGLACIALLFSTQLIAGMILTRLHYSYGITTKNKARLIDPSLLDVDWIPKRVDLEFEELKTTLNNVFTTVLGQNSNEIDDYNDVAWFVILLWSLISSVIGNFIYLESTFYIFGALVTALTCLMTFMNGYQSANLAYLIDDLDHLEYYILSRLSKMDMKDSRKMAFIEWFSKYDTIALNDVGFRLNCGGNELCYYIGLPSLKNERIEIQITNDSTSTLTSRMKALSAKSNWSFTLQSKENYTWIQLCNEIDEGTLGLHSISAINLNAIEQASSKVCEFVNEVIEICSVQ